MARDAYLSRRAMQFACDLESKARGRDTYHGWPSYGSLYVERCVTDTPLFRICENLAHGGCHVHFTGSSREIRAYLRGMSDLRYDLREKLA